MHILIICNAYTYNMQCISLSNSYHPVYPFSTLTSICKLKTHAPAFTFAFYTILATIAVLLANTVM